MELKDLAKIADSFCKSKGWIQDWKLGGCYLHLESSELIESLRGKRGNPAEEASDVLTALLSMTEYYGIDTDEIIESFIQKKINLT